MKRHIPLLAVAVAVGAGSFFGGMTYANSQTQAVATNARAVRFGNGAVNGTGGAQGQFAGNRNGGIVTGEVIAKDDKSITVKLPDGGSKLVFLSDSTSIAIAASGTISDVDVGKEVTAIGQSTSDGSVTANMVQIGSVGLRGFAGVRTVDAGAVQGGQPAQQAPAGQ